MKNPTYLAIGVVASVALVFGGTHCGSSSPGSKVDAVKEKSGASSCEDSTYWMSDRDGKNKQFIYNCVINGQEKCVTFQNNIAADATEEVKLVFSDAFSKPTCAEAEGE